jgi:hypothetical protein
MYGSVEPGTVIDPAGPADDGRTQEEKGIDGPIHQIWLGNRMELAGIQRAVPGRRPKGRHGFLQATQVSDGADQGPGRVEGPGRLGAEGQGLKLKHQGECFGEHGDPPVGSIGPRGGFCKA